MISFVGTAGWWRPRHRPSNGIWRFIRRTPREYSHLDQRKIIQQSTGVAVADDPRGIRARRVANAMNADLERHWRDMIASDVPSSVRDYEAARQAARRLGISEPIANAEQRTIAELIDRIEKLQGALADRPSVLAVFDAAPKPAITFRSCAEQFIESHRAGWSNNRTVGQWSTSLATYVYPVMGDLPVDKIGSNGDGTCPYRKSNPDVLMMQSSQERFGNDAANGLDRTRNRRILAQR